jgi:hypothetical protein
VRPGWALRLCRSIEGVAGLDEAGDVEELHALSFGPFVDPSAPETVGSEFVFAAQPVLLLVVFLA